MSQRRMGHATITYRYRLYKKHHSRFEATKILYNQVVEHYYRILLEKPELLTLSGHELLRRLECLSVGTREMRAAGKQPEYLLEQKVTAKIPLYFRRSAINNAVGAVRRDAWQKVGKEENAGRFQMSPVYYKGMYRNWKPEEQTIELKLYDGTGWQWSQYRYTGRKLPEEAVCQSPVLVVEKDIYLHVPVEIAVEDTRSVKERMLEAEKILAVAFPSDDSLAVGVVMNREGEMLSSRFWKGGRERKAARNLYKYRIVQTKRKGQAGKKYQEKTTQLNDTYAHQVSRGIVEFCREQGISVIAVPNYQRAIDFKEENYLHTDNFEWIGRRIIQYLKYKAYANGMVVSTVPVYHITDSCSVCGAKLQRYHECDGKKIPAQGGSLYCCLNGHQGSSGLNTAKNIGKKFLSFYPDDIRRGIKYNRD